MISLIVDKCSLLVTNYNQFDAPFDDFYPCHCLQQHYHCMSVTDTMIDVDDGSFVVAIVLMV